MRLRQTFALIFAGVFLQGCLEAVPSQTPSGQPAAQPASATTVAATASNAPAYPVPLATVAMRREVGIIGNASRSDDLAKKCYYYGDGGTSISVSNQFLAKYRARGFSQQTMCMGLVSEIRYHPETGKRLATVVFGESPQPTELITHGMIEFVSSGEIPLQLPSCFRRGLPMSDCKFNFNPYTGKRFGSSDTAKVAQAGAVALQAGRALLASGKYARACRAGESSGGDQLCYLEVSPPGSGSAGYFRTEQSADIIGNDDVQFWGFADISPVFPEGFGYAFGADGTAGPSFDMASASLKIDGKSRASQADLDTLKILVASE